MDQSLFAMLNFELSSLELMATVLDAEAHEVFPTSNYRSRNTQPNDSSQDLG